VREIDISSDELIRWLLSVAADRRVGVLDSCAVGHQNSHLLIAGIDPVETISIGSDSDAALQAVDHVVASDSAAIFTLSYDLGRLIQKVDTKHEAVPEPLAHIDLFDGLIIHDYASGKTRSIGRDPSDDRIEEIQAGGRRFDEALVAAVDTYSSNISRDQYLKAVEAVKEEIRSGNTYQTNITRKVTTKLSDGLTPAGIFARLRRDNPSPFSAFIRRPDSTVISASPERFFRIENGTISASPIKGTRPRGATAGEDERLRSELLSSKKDRAENTMIVDLLRNDLGRVCEFGSVAVESLCEIDELPSLFHLVSTINGKLRPEVSFGEILTALFPCGSITGAPKISTMKIIDSIESGGRGLSMGAIGSCIPASFGLGASIDLSVAIRTMVIRDGVATFNVGGGIVIDSDPEREWEETVVKSKALLNSMGVEV
jgi:para-aminobenzoate synthetase component 1